MLFFRDRKKLEAMHNAIRSLRSHSKSWRSTLTQDLFQRALEAWQADDLPATFAAINLAMQSPTASDPALFELLGKALLKAQMPAEAAEAFMAAAERAGGGGFVHWKSAMLAHETAGQNDKAFHAALKAQKLGDGDPDVIFILARELAARGEAELLAHFKNRLTASDDPRHLDLAKQLIGADNRNPFNLALFKKLARLTPDDPFIRFKLMSIAREFCDYDTIDVEEAWLNTELAAGRKQVFEAETPYSNLLHCADERLNRLAVNNSAIPVPPRAGLTAERRAMPHQWSDKIRIGYLSGDFASTHATMRLLRHVLECHDRQKFEITLYCYTPQSLIDADDGGRAAWGRIVSVRDLNDGEAAARIRADGIDILVDLKGHTGGSRAQILNFKTAPIQVAWLGFPGSTVNVDLDYIIADRFVIPIGSERHYHESVVRLPHCYQPNDPVHRPLPPAATRQSLGLPEESFVFASFNASRKITPQTLDLWAEILLYRPDSVLWVLIDSEIARQNSLARLHSRGITVDRIVFAANAEYPDHIARLQAADLGLDTFPYNGHTTTSDMLWAGLPVLTRKGTNFASRVSESLLAACGLEELVASDERSFVQMAVSASRSALAAARQKITSNRRSLPLFDSNDFCRDLEKAYEIMKDRAKINHKPGAIDL